MSQPVASFALTIVTVISMPASFGHEVAAARRNGQWQPSMPGTTGSVTSGSRAGIVHGDDVMAVREQFEHAAEAALPATNTDRVLNASFNRRAVADQPFVIASPASRSWSAG